jgi:peptidoglycan/LPS O-acetylase OafA/YrhL
MTAAPLPQAATVQTQPIRLPNLDLLRIAAAVMVVAFHFAFRGPATPGWTPSAYPEVAPYAQEMWAGVSLFFMISGFVIAWSAEKRDAFRFALSRAARLYPAFIVCMTLTAVAMAALAPGGVDEFRMTFARWLGNAPLFSKAFGQPFVDGAYWSIVVEAIFYGWVALFLALGLLHRRQLTILSAWLALAFLNEVILRQQGLQVLFVTRHAGSAFWPTAPSAAAVGLRRPRCFWRRRRSRCACSTTSGMWAGCGRRWAMLPSGIPPSLLRSSWRCWPR